jgi:hypothetical protein
MNSSASSRAMPKKFVQHAHEGFIPFEPAVDDLCSAIER